MISQLGSLFRSFKLHDGFLRVPFSADNHNTAAAKNFRASQLLRVSLQNALVILIHSPA